jgi:hypothetical protein
LTTLTVSSAINPGPWSIQYGHESNLDDEFKKPPLKEGGIFRGADNDMQHPAGGIVEEKHGDAPGAA